LPITHGKTNKTWDNLAIHFLAAQQQAKINAKNNTGKDYHAANNDTRQGIMDLNSQFGTSQPNHGPR
jgi:hypothetical protein